MTESSFIPEKYTNYQKKGSIIWQSPSNIALIKYWGKHGKQFPKNPSISFTLDVCNTTTELKFQLKENSSNDFNFEVFFGGKISKDFKPKIETFFERVEVYLPFLKRYKFEIHTSNTFPHSSGIASSASGMSALAACLVSLENRLLDKPTLETGIDSGDSFSTKKTSFIARLGSGSACRSIEGDLVVWGKHEEILGSSDLFGIKYPYEVHDIFDNYQDTILIVDEGEKQVSSSLGHQLMYDHPYAANRFKQAHDNLAKMIPILKEGAISEFIEIVESEALSLHAMMLTSLPYFILMKANTLEIINKIWSYRKETKSNICFTLDAGANVHVLYPSNEKDSVLEFIKNDLVGYCQNGKYICDQIGFGIKKM